MKKVYYTSKPEPATFSILSGTTKLNVVIATNIIQEDEMWVADTHSFSEEKDLIDKEFISANPEKFMSYIPVNKRAALQQKYTDAIQKWMDNTAHTRGYDDIFTAISYADSSVPKFKAEGQACKLWRDKVWVECYDYLDKVLSGEVELIPIEELILKLPQIEW